MPQPKEPPKAVVDACILLALAARTLLLQLHSLGLCHLYHSNLIRDEYHRNLVRLRNEGVADAAEAIIVGFLGEPYWIDEDDHRIDDVYLAEAKDRHVLFLRRSRVLISCSQIMSYIFPIGRCSQRRTIGWSLEKIFGLPIWMSFCVIYVPWIITVLRLPLPTLSTC